MFSPYYAARRRHAAGGLAPAEAHCALNVALYAPGGGGAQRWAMTERGHAALATEPERLVIGPSRLEWQGDALVVHIDEIATPWPRRLRGTVRLHPTARATGAHALDAQGRHHWQPIAPAARVEVEMSHPGLRWSGHGYLDTNRGARPLEADFARWDWSRAGLAGGRSAVLYDVQPVTGTPLALALHFDARGDVEAFAPPPRAALPRTAWRVARGTRSDAAATVLDTLEDTPFYARSLLQAELLGEAVTAVHESLSLERFASRWVQALLPFRMPRRG